MINLRNLGLENPTSLDDFLFEFDDHEDELLKRKRKRKIPFKNDCQDENL